MVPSWMTKEQTMSPLRARMIEDMKLAGLAGTTQGIYLQAVRSLAKHYNRSPELLCEEEVRRYLLDIRERNARGSFKTSHYGIQFVRHFGHASEAAHHLVEQLAQRHPRRFGQM